jgi:hypothetical protein
MRCWISRAAGVLCIAAGLLAVVTQSLRGADPVAGDSAVADPAAAHPDARLTVRTLNDAYHPWTPPESLAEWEQEKSRIQRQILVAVGLWPLPEKTPLKPVIHGQVEREGYTVERVFFASRPGLYVTGSLYRPAGSRDGSVKRPGVLCPHGHWANGRFYDAGEEEAARQVASGAETDLVAARSPLQARFVQLARMGCVVFHYDMVGYADHAPLAHNSGFNDVQAELWSQNIMGLQTWNSIRALDFLESLPDVDPNRIGVTGASGGGTQTFILAAIDDRPDVLFPAVMVSTAMQGGCVCENASYLRLGLNNVAFAACAAPRPMALSGADDWTIDIEKLGLPELKQVYGLYDKPDLVHAKCYPEFGHNYNKVSRLMMYEWFNQHLGLGWQSPIDEQPFTPLTREELTVFTDEHPLPEDARTAEQLREMLTAETAHGYEQLLDTTARDAAEYDRVVGGAAEVMFGPPPGFISTYSQPGFEIDGGATVTRGWCVRPESNDRVPYLQISPAEPTGAVTVWADEFGSTELFTAEGQPRAEVASLLAHGETVLIGDLLFTGDSKTSDGVAVPTINETFAGYTFGYNRPLVANRVRDVVTLYSFARKTAGTGQVRLYGSRGAGVWVMLARSVLGDNPPDIVIDTEGFAVAEPTGLSDPNLLPGALKFGGFAGLAAAAPGGKVELAGPGTVTPEWLEPLTRRGVEISFREQPLLPPRE